MTQRIINDTFWTDPYIEDLDPSEKLIFLYLLTNPLCNIAWAYEIKTKRIAYETWFDKDMIEKILRRFEKDNKIMIAGEWIILVNFAKNQSNNPNVLKWMQRILDSIPMHILKALKGFERLPYFTLLNLTLPNFTLLNLEEEKSKELITQNLKNFETLVKEEILLNIDFINSLKIKYNLTDQDIKKELEFFYLYWSEKNKSWKKEKWELEKTFEIRKRFYKWLDNSKKRNNKNNFNKKSVWITSI